MSTTGKNFISSVIKSGNKNYLNRVKDELFTPDELPTLTSVRQHVMQYRVLPSPSVLQRDGYAYVETDQPPEYYIEELKKRAIFNSWKSFQNKMKPLVNNKFDLDLASQYIQELSQTVSRLSVSDRFKTLAELGHEIQAEIENRKQGHADKFIPFGWPTIDRLTGGVTAGDLVYIVARPGVGKSQLLSYCSSHAYKNGFSPLVLTMEMTDVQLARRIYGINGQFNHDAIRREIPDSEVERRLNEAVHQFEQSEVQFNVICGQVRQTVENVATLVDELKPDVLYVDAAYLLNLKNTNAKNWEKIAIVGERLKEIAISRSIPIIQTVQFNRDAAKNKRFEMDNIAGSDAIGQLGSVIIAVQPGQEPYEETRRNLQIIKNREGGVAEIEVNYTFDPPCFSEVEYVRAEEDELKL